MKRKTSDVKSSAQAPYCVLSNFHPNAFVLDGVVCASMEGFLQSLKTRNTAEQERVCLLCGKDAKNYFKNRIENTVWKLTGVLWWRGRAYRRDSDEYQRLLDRAYLALSKNPTFREALLGTCKEALTHSIGKRRTGKTVLTEYELISRLIRLRNRIIREENAKNGQ